MEDRDRLRREQDASKRGFRPPSRTARVGSKVVTVATKVMGSFFSRGGLRHPDSMITRGRNRSLFVTEGSALNPLPGRERPLQGKESLTGRPRSNPRLSQRRRPKGLTFQQKLRKASRSILG